MVKNIAIGVLSIGAALLTRQVLIERKRNENLIKENKNLLDDAKELAKEVKKVTGEIKEAQRRANELSKEINEIKAELQAQEACKDTETPKPEEKVSEDNKSTETK